MHCHTIPYQDKYIIYRPLRRLAFVGNSPMAELCANVYANPSFPVKAEQQTAYDFLESVGFPEPDILFPEAPMENAAFQPTVCVLFLTNVCNLRCIYCYAHGGDNRPEKLTIELAQAAIDNVCQNASEQGLDHYMLSFHGGGEPIMAWRVLQDCVAYARQTELPVNINLTSNGVWTENQRSWLLDHIDEISLSLDGPPEVQNRQRPRLTGRASHPAVMATVRELDRRNKSYGIRVTITDETIDQLPDIVAYLCRETGAQTLQVEPAFNHGRARKDHQALLQNERFAEMFLAGYDIAHEQGRHMYYSGARPWLLTNRFCEAFNKALIVGPDGFVTSCYEVCGRDHELAGDFIFGEMDRQGLLSINPRIRRKLLTRIEERRQLCRACFCYFHCAGDCPSKTFSPGAGSHLVHGSRCDLNRTITKELIIRYILEGEGVWNGEENH